MDKSSGVDVYQKRYLTHQEYKLGASGSKSIYTFAEAHAILAALNNRQSCRVFGEDRINPYVLKKIYEAARNAPSSCNRKAIKIITVVDPSEIGMLSNLLVGGANWLSMAEVVLLLFADMIAYKSPSEIDFMPYLDAGFLAENIYIACEALGLALVSSILI